MSCAGTVASLATTRRIVDKSGDRIKVGEKQVRKVTNMLMDGLGMVSMLTYGERFQNGGRQRTIGHLGKQKNRDQQHRRMLEQESGRAGRVKVAGAASPTPRPTRSPSESSATSEMSVSSVGSWTKSFCAMVRWFALQKEDEMRFFDDGAVEDEPAETEEPTEVMTLLVKRTHKTSRLKKLWRRRNATD